MRSTPEHSLVIIHMWVSSAWVCVLWIDSNDNAPFTTESSSNMRMRSRECGRDSEWIKREWIGSVAIETRQHIELVQRNGAGNKMLNCYCFFSFIQTRNKQIQIKINTYRDDEIDTIYTHWADQEQNGKWRRKKWINRKLLLFQTKWQKKNETKHDADIVHFRYI